MLDWDILDNQVIVLKKAKEYMSMCTFAGFSTEQVYASLQSEFAPHMQTGSSRQCGRIPLPFVTSLLKHINAQLASLMLLAFSYDVYVIDTDTEKPSKNKLCSRRTHSGKYTTAGVDCNKKAVSVMFVCGDSGDSVDLVYSTAQTHGSNVLKDDSDSEYQNVGKHTTPCCKEEVKSALRTKTLRAGRMYVLPATTFMPEYPFQARKDSTSKACVMHFVCLPANECGDSNPFVLPSTSSALITRSVVRDSRVPLARSELHDVVKRFDNLDTDAQDTAVEQYLHCSTRCYTAVPEVGCDAKELEKELMMCPLHRGCGCLQITSSMSLRELVQKRYLAKITSSQAEKRKHAALSAENKQLRKELQCVVEQKKAVQASLYISGGPVWEGVVHEVKRQAVCKERMQAQVFETTKEHQEGIKNMLTDCITQEQLGKENDAECDVVCVHSLCGNITLFNSHTIAAWIFQTGFVAKQAATYKLAPKTPGGSSTIPLPPEQVLAAIARHAAAAGMTLRDICRTSKWAQQVQLYADPVKCPRAPVRAAVRAASRYATEAVLHNWDEAQNNATIVNGIETLETPWRKVCKDALSVFVEEARAKDFLGPNFTPEIAITLTWCTKTNFIREVSEPAWRACDIMEKAANTQ
jgi:hypothetical protein